MSHTTALNNPQPLRQAAAYILYKPDIERLKQSLEVTLRQTKRIYIADNSGVLNPELQSLLAVEGITYIDMRRNQGVAKALNIVCRRASADGYDWLLTLDQDSIIPDNLIQEYAHFLHTYLLPEEVGILSPKIKVSDDSLCIQEQKVTEIAFAYTSGSFISLEAYGDTKGFKDDLFIDYVDTEYSFNLRRLGYRIFMLEHVILDHQLGRTKEYRLFGRHLFYVTNHDRIRRYYMVRNSQTVNKWYRGIIPHRNLGFKNLLTQIVKIIFFEEDKMAKLKAARMGYRDYRREKLGPYRYD